MKKIFMYLLFLCISHVFAQDLIRVKKLVKGFSSPKTLAKNATKEIFENFFQKLLKQQKGVKKGDVLKKALIADYERYIHFVSHKKLTSFLAYKTIFVSVTINKKELLNIINDYKKWYGTQIKMIWKVKGKDYFRICEVIHKRLKSIFNKHPFSFIKLGKQKIILVWDYYPTIEIPEIKKAFLWTGKLQFRFLASPKAGGIDPRKERFEDTKQHVKLLQKGFKWYKARKMQKKHYLVWINDPYQIDGECFLNFKSSFSHIGQQVILFTLKKKYIATFEEVTRKYRNEYLGILFNEQIISAPKIVGTIPNGMGYLTGLKNDEHSMFSKILKSGTISESCEYLEIVRGKNLLSKNVTGVYCNMIVSNKKKIEELKQWFYIEKIQRWKNQYKVWGIIPSEKKLNGKLKALNKKLRKQYTEKEKLDYILKTVNATPYKKELSKVKLLTYSTNLKNKVIEMKKTYQKILNLKEHFVTKVKKENAEVRNCVFFEVVGKR